MPAKMHLANRTTIWSTDEVQLSRSQRPDPSICSARFFRSMSSLGRKAAWFADAPQGRGSRRRSLRSSGGRPKITAAEFGPARCRGYDRVRCQRNGEAGAGVRARAYRSGHEPAPERVAAGNRGGAAPAAGVSRFACPSERAPRGVVRGSARRRDDRRRCCDRSRAEGERSMVLRTPREAAGDGGRPGHRPRHDPPGRRHPLRSQRDRTATTVTIITGRRRPGRSDAARERASAPGSIPCRGDDAAARDGLVSSGERIPRRRQRPAAVGRRGSSQRRPSAGESQRRPRSVGPAAEEAKSRVRLHRRHRSPRAGSPRPGTAGRSFASALRVRSAEGRGGGVLQPSSARAWAISSGGGTRARCAGNHERRSVVGRCGPSAASAERRRDRKSFFGRFGSRWRRCARGRRFGSGGGATPKRRGRGGPTDGTAEGAERAEGTRSRGSLAGRAAPLPSGPARRSTRRDDPSAAKGWRGRSERARGVLCSGRCCGTRTKGAVRAWPKGAGDVARGGRSSREDAVTCRRTLRGVEPDP